MMWDFSGRLNNPGGYAQPPQPIPIPPPSPHPPNVMMGGMASYPGQYPVASSATSGGFLTVPQPQMPAVVHAHSDGHHHRHRRHSHSHHRSHSNPPPDKGIVFVEDSHFISQSRRHHRHTHSVTPEPRLHHHHSQTVLQPAPMVVQAHPQSSHHHLVKPAQIHHQNPQHAFNSNFQYSKCTGRKKAVCVGVNYFGQPHELRGCINDARHMRDFLIRHFGYRGENIVLLTDDNPNPKYQPTRRNMLDAMRWLVEGAQTHDSLVFHYSGHGGQTPDEDGDEVDGFDEVIYPLDFKKRGHIVDDEMHAIMVKPLPTGCRLTAIFDCCHSGTVLDLPYIYSSHGRLKGSHISRKAAARMATSADAISWSGCKDGEKSADTFHGGVAVGAMSYAFIQAIKQNPKQSYQQLLANIRKILYPKYAQKPQLGSSHHIDTSLQFVM